MRGPRPFRACSSTGGSGSGAVLHRHLRHEVADAGRHPDCWRSRSSTSARGGLPGLRLRGSTSQSGGRHDHGVPLPRDRAAVRTRVTDPYRQDRHLLHRGGSGRRRRFPSSTMTNLSAARARPENSKNYFGDKWYDRGRLGVLPARSPSSTGTSTTPAAFDAGEDPDRLGPRRITYDPAYWPCDELNGGDIASGTGCYAEPRDVRRRRTSSACTRRTPTPRTTQTYITSPIPVVSAADLDRGLQRNDALRFWRATRTTATRAARRATSETGPERGTVHLGLHAERRPLDGNPRDRADRRRPRSS